MLDRFVNRDHRGTHVNRPRAVRRTIAVFGLSFFVTVGFTIGLPAPGAAPSLRAVVDLEATQPLYRLAVLRPPALETFDTEVVPTALTRTVKVGRGDTLMGLLTEAGISRNEAHQAISALSEVYRPRDLKPGQAIRLSLQPNDPTAKEIDTDGTKGLGLIGMSLEPNVEETLRVVRDDTGDGFIAGLFERPLTRSLVGNSGVIESSLFTAGQKAGVPTPVMIELIRAFSYDVDFQREVRKADDFELIYESHHDEGGNLAKTGEVIYAALTLSGRKLELYRFTPKSGRTDYFDAQGQSVRKALLRTPVDGARVSSRFGMRKHPILGYSKMHRGVDFAAPRGTPIFAAGDGTITQVGRKGGYGKYVRLRHTSNYQTAYAHLHKFAKGLKKGQRVKQGDVIGYVGSTGRSTGPHLHYEVLKNGRQVNPTELKLPKGEKLRGADLEAFIAERARIDALRGVGKPSTAVAQVAANPGCVGSVAASEDSSAAGTASKESSDNC